jgi:ketosteroid isomerase-like protein
MSPTPAPLQASDLRARIDAFVQAFNVNDLDAVMTYFGEDAVYRPGDGTEHRGKVAIRQAFAPQFAGAFGKMRFDEIDRLVDEDARKVSIRWICRHDFQGANGAAIPLVKRAFYRMMGGGPQVGWQGLDVFHFDTAGHIIGKFSYGEARFPLLEKKYAERL